MESLFSPTAIDRIFYGELLPKAQQVRGYRFDSEGARLRGCEMILNSQTAPDTFGVYASGVRVHGVKRKQSKSAFFPATWTREQVVIAIIEAYQNTQDKRQGWTQGTTGDGLMIDVLLDGEGRIDDAKPAYTVRTSKRVKKCCDVCGQSKVRLCPNGHHYQPYAIRIAIPKWMRWLKRYLRWRYFHTLRKLNTT